MSDDALIIFLRARVSEREVKARAVQDGGAPWGGQCRAVACSSLAHIAAKHEILGRAQELRDAHSLATTRGDALGEYTETVLPALASLYSEHPDSRAAWKP